MKVSIGFVMAFLMLNCSSGAQREDVAFEVDSNGNFVREVQALEVSGDSQSSKNADKDQVEVAAPTSGAFSGALITKDMQLSLKPDLEKVVSLSVRATFNPQAQLRVQNERAQWEATK
jgi:hypothetical protein